MMNDIRIGRRGFLAGAGGALAAVGVSAAASRRIGLQLYTVRELFERDPVGTLEQVARIGYREVEFGGANYEAMDHRRLRRSMDRLGLRAPSIHVLYETLLTRFVDTVAMARTLGADTIVIPWLAPEHRTGAGLTALVGNFRRIGEQARDAGLSIAYHNHDFEFTTRVGNVSLYDRLVADTDPALLKLELDLYWAAHAGEDVAALVNRLSRRLYAFHVKDMRADRTMAAVGTGTIDFAHLFRLPGARAVCHFYVENDETPAPYLPDITTSYRHLSAMRF